MGLDSTAVLRLLRRLPIQQRSRALRQTPRSANDATSRSRWPPAACFDSETNACALKRSASWMTSTLFFLRRQSFFSCVSIVLFGFSFLAWQFDCDTHFSCSESASSPTLDVNCARDFDCCRAHIAQLLFFLVIFFLLVKRESTSWASIYAQQRLRQRRLSALRFVFTCVVCPPWRAAARARQVEDAKSLRAATSGQRTRVNARRRAEARGDVYDRRLHRCAANEESTTRATEQR